MMRAVSSVDRTASVPLLQQWRRGPINELHRAARYGSLERTIDLLARGSIDVDNGDPNGQTPLMLSSFYNHPAVVRILLKTGANLSIATDGRVTALHFSAQRGHLAVINLLTEARADLEATVGGGFTPLQLAVQGGHPQVTTALIEAGANINHRKPDGTTPLYAAAWYGHVDCVRVLLRARADPLLTRTNHGSRFTPLDAAAENGHSRVAYELIHHLGSEAIGGDASVGVSTLGLAAKCRRVSVMAVLTDAGVVDTGTALAGAAGFGNEASVSFLLEQEQESTVAREGSYANSRDHLDRPALVLCIVNCRPCSPRIARLLINAGADSTSAVRVKDEAGSVVCKKTPLAMVMDSLGAKKVNGEDASEEQLHALEAIRRLLLQVDAVRAVSWVWPNHVPAIGDAADGTRSTKMASAVESPMSRMLPTLKLRGTRQRELWASLSRYSKEL